MLRRRDVLAVLGAALVAPLGCARWQFPALPRRRIAGKRVIVIGAGIAGLAAATRLAEDGASVSVIEALDRPGGRVFATTRPAWDGPQELGAQYLHDRYDALLPLFASVAPPGSGPVLATLSGQTATIVGGQPAIVDAAAPRTYVTSGVLGTLDALAIKMAYDDVASGVRELPLDDLAAWYAQDDETAASWLVRHYGPRGADYVGIPAIESLFFVAAARTSAAVFKWMIANADRARRWYTNPGSNYAMCTRLVDALRAAGVGITFGSPVAHIEQVRSAAGDDAVKVQLQLQGGVTVDADAAIVTVPGPVAARLVAQLDQEQATSAAQTYASTIVVNVVVDRRDPRLAASGGVYAVSVPRVENPGGVIASFSVETGKTASSHGGRELYGFHLHDEPSRALLARADDAIVQAVIAEASRFIPSIRSGYVDAVVQRWEHAIPVMDVGCAMRRRRLWDEQARSSSRIVLAGDHTTVATMDGAARSGIRAAEVVAWKLAGDGVRSTATRV